MIEKSSIKAELSIMSHPARSTVPPIASFNQHTTLMFTNYNLIDESRTLAWSKAYHFQQQEGQPSFFQTQKQQTKVKDVNSAQYSWSKFNPEKEQTHQFDVFKMFKEYKQTTDTTHIDIEEKIEEGQGLVEPKENIIMEQKKPPPFMGAFSHVQPQFNFFNLNISIPTAQQYKPFSCFYQEESNEEDYKVQRNQFNHLEVSKISVIKDIKHQHNHSHHQNNQQYFFQIDSAESQISQIGHQQPKDITLKQSKIEANIESQGERSLLWSYAALLEQRSNFKHRDPMWEQISEQRDNKQSRIFQVNRQDNLKTLHSMELQLNLAQEMKEVLSDEYVKSEISKIMQNVQCQLFTLDYDKMEWSLDINKCRLQHTFKNSLKYRIKDILLIANYRSRIDVALIYIRKRPFRRVYFQLGVQITDILILFEEIILEQARQCNLIQFFIRIDKLKLEIVLLYKLLINQSYIIDQKRSFEDFDYRYLNSEYVIFKQIVKQSKMADSLNTQIKPMITNLLSAVFKPIITILNNILFEECTIIELNDEIYLKYFFDNHKDIVNFISKKIGLIKQESHQLYQICRIKQKIEILNNLQELQEYQHKWDKTFSRKRKLIERIRKNYKLKIKSEREKKHEQRMKFIYSLKSRIYQQNQEQNAKKRMINLKNKEELQRLKKDIDARQERRKLLQQLEKEKEKGLILDIELQQKQRLQKEKDQLLIQINEIIQPNTEKKQHSLKSQTIEKTSEKILQNIAKIQEEQFPKSQLMLQQRNPSIKQQIKPVQSQSQDHINSNNSIQSNKMIFTADNFLLKGDRNKRNSSKLSKNNRTQSYFRLASKHQKQSLQLQIDSNPSSDYSMEVEQLSQNEDQFHPLSLQLQISRQLDLSTSLQICFSDIIKKQLQVIQSSLHFLVIDKYEIIAIINFMRNVFMCGNGERVQEFISVAINQNSMLNLKYFSQCLLFDNNLESIERLQPSFYHSKNQNKYNTEINIFEENIQNYIGFQFKKMPIILQPYFSYIHLSKYMQIFNFIVRLKYCQKLITKSWKLLNNYKKDLQYRQRQGQDVESELKLMMKLYSVRYIINNFLITFQNYMFLKIIEKEAKIMRMNINNLHDLQQNHLKMLDNIIKFAFIDNSNQNISKIFRRNLTYINQFYQIIYQLTLDDIPLYRWQQTQEKVNLIYLNFKKQQKYIENLILKLT